jgi:hypothetical protein
VIEPARREADLPIVVVHEFRTENMNEPDLKMNAQGFGAFVGIFCALPADDVTPGQLYGPVTLSQGEHLPRRVDVLIGKAVFDWSPTTRS